MCTQKFYFRQAHSHKALKNDWDPSRSQIIIWCNGDYFVGYIHGSLHSNDVKATFMFCLATYPLLLNCNRESKAQILMIAICVVYNIHEDGGPTVYPKKYAHGFCFAVLCCAYTLTDCPISIRLISLALWQSNDCPSASKATLMNMDKYFMWIHYERLHNHNKAKHNKTVCICLGIYCICHFLN